VQALESLRAGDRFRVLGIPRVNLSAVLALVEQHGTQQFEAANALLDQSAYELYDASLVWTSSDRRYQAGLHGKNLGDKEYKIAGYDFPTLGGSTITAFYGNPRQVFGSFSVKF